MARENINVGDIIPFKSKEPTADMTAIPDELYNEIRVGLELINRLLDFIKKRNNPEIKIIKKLIANFSVTNIDLSSIREQIDKLLKREDDKDKIKRIDNMFTKLEKRLENYYSRHAQDNSCSDGR